MSTFLRRTWLLAGTRRLDAVDKRYSTSGLLSQELLFGVWAMLAVEGYHDRVIIEAAFGLDLAERGVVLFQLGAFDAQTTAQIDHDDGPQLIATTGLGDARRSTHRPRTQARPRHQQGRRPPESFESGAHDGSPSVDGVIHD